ncbi:signal peptide peptidase SppA [Leptolyngbya sp. AN02str]|uniref:signal peptide peptidase SppA n=1 Tax=Leptolyngbya sp. AN02str TaxID=3423363 RepID=UPI003D323C01
MANFLKQILATLIGLVLFVSLGFGGLLVLVAAVSLSSPKPQVKDKTVLTFNLAQGISDAGSGTQSTDPISSLLSGSPTEPISLRDAVRAIQTAATDDRIVGIYLYGSGQSGASTGFATLREFRDALETFRNSNKPIYAYSTGWNERDYYLTSVATEVVMNPAGDLEFNGLGSEAVFFGEALQKLGVEVQPIRAGQYKSAVEPFTRNSSSPEDRQQRQVLLNDLWQEVLTTVASHRDLTPQALQTVADQRGILLADEAQTSGLVDRVAYVDEVFATLATLAESDDRDDDLGFQRMGLANYVEVAEAESDRQGDEVALVYLDGDIVNGSGTTGQIAGDRTASLIRRLRQDDDVKAIVLRINSPGGSATASDAIAREVQLAREAKPVIASMGNTAASGGYQIATQAQTIYAAPNTITGSIGVFGLVPNVQKLANDNGITWDVVKTGRYADMLTLSRPLTPDELAIQQKFVDRFYSSFVDMVAKTRELPQQQVANIAGGRVWSGVNAQQIGLVDELGSLDDALQAAAEAAELGDDWYVEEYPKATPFRQELLASLFSTMVRSPASQDAVSQYVQRLQTELSRVQTLDDPKGLYTRLPFQLWID